MVVWWLHFMNLNLLLDLFNTGDCCGHSFWSPLELLDHISKAFHNLPINSSMTFFKRDLKFFNIFCHFFRFFCEEWFHDFFVDFIALYLVQLSYWMIISSLSEGHQTITTQWRAWKDHARVVDKAIVAVFCCLINDAIFFNHNSFHTKFHTMCL